MSRNISVFLDIEKLSTEEIIDLIKNHELYSSCCKFIEEKSLGGQDILGLTESQISSWKSPKWLMRNLLSLKQSLLNNPEVFLNSEEDDELTDYSNTSSIINQQNSSRKNISNQLETIFKPQAPLEEFYDETNYLKPSDVNPRNFDLKHIKSPDIKSLNKSTPIQFRSPVALPREEVEEENVYESAPNEETSKNYTLQHHSSKNLKSSIPTPKLPERKQILLPFNRRKLPEENKGAITSNFKLEIPNRNNVPQSFPATTLLKDLKSPGALKKNITKSENQDELYDDPNENSMIKLIQKPIDKKIQPHKLPSLIAQDQKLKKFLKLNTTQSYNKNTPTPSDRSPSEPEVSSSKNRRNNEDHQKDHTNSTLLKSKPRGFLQGGIFRRNSSSYTPRNLSQENTSENKVLDSNDKGSKEYLNTTSEKRPYYENANEVNSSSSRKNYIGLKNSEVSSRKSLMNRPLPPIPNDREPSIKNPNEKVSSSWIDEDHQHDKTDGLFLEATKPFQKHPTSRLSPVLFKPLPPLPKGEDQPAKDEIKDLPEDENLPDYANTDKLKPNVTEPQTTYLKESNLESIRSLVLRKEVNLEDSFADALRRKLQERKNHLKDTNKAGKTENPLVLPAPPAEFPQNVFENETENQEQCEYNSSEQESDAEYDDFGSDFNPNNEEFYRNTDRKGAKLLLSDLEDGAFVLRPSQHKDQYFLSITVKKSRKYFNAGIMRTPSGNFFCGQGHSKTPEFPTIKSFLDFFEINPLIFPGQNGIEKVYLRRILPASKF